MKTTQKIRSVAVAVKLSDASWRDFLMGFFDYAKRGTHWDIRVVQSADELQRAVSGCQGVVTGIEPDRKTQALLAKAGTPLVAIGSEWKLAKKSRAVCIRNDNEDIGRFCAQHFQTLGKFASAGFVHSNKDDDWSIAENEDFSEDSVISKNRPSVLTQNRVPTKISHLLRSGLNHFQNRLRSWPPGTCELSMC